MRCLNSLDTAELMYIDLYTVLAISIIYQSQSSMSSAVRMYVVFLTSEVISFASDVFTGFFSVLYATYTVYVRAIPVLSRSQLLIIT